MPFSEKRQLALLDKAVQSLRTAVRALEQLSERVQADLERKEK